MKFVLIVWLLVVSISGLSQTTETHDEFKKHFDEAKVQGSFSLYDMKNDKYILHNATQFKQGFTPASTFKICNSLIGLETGVIKDENFVIKWDGVKREREAWNHDQDLKTAYKNSTVPYYQELARRVGGKRMKYWLDKTRYGNSDTSGGIDLFWLRALPAGRQGGMRVSPEQQLNFLKRLYKSELPFSKRSMEIVKKIMIEEETPSYVLRTKTGWDGRDDMSIGWYVGYITKGDNAYFFATCIQSAKPRENFAVSRKTITRKILAALNIIPKTIKPK